MGSVRLLLGNKPEARADIGLREVSSKSVKGLIKVLFHASFDEKTLRAVEDPTAFLRQDNSVIPKFTNRCSQTLGSLAFHMPLPSTARMTSNYLPRDALVQGE
jgi:hypothetical protein